jgi:hypothetical protein
LAPAGRRLLARMDAPVSKMDALLSTLSDSQVATLIRLLDALRAGLASDTTRRKA